MGKKFSCYIFCHFNLLDSQIPYNFWLKKKIIYILKGKFNFTY